MMKKAHALTHIVFFISVLLAAISTLTFTPEGNIPFYNPSLVDKIIIRGTWACLFIGFGWSAIALSQNRTNSGLELATAIGLVGGVIGVLYNIENTIGEVKILTSANFISFMYIIVLSMNLFFIDKFESYGLKPTILTKGINTIQNKNKNPTSSIGHATWILVEIIFLWVVLLIIWLVGFVLFIEPLSNSPQGIHRAVTTVRTGIGVVSTLGLAFVALFGPVILFFRRTKLLSNE